MRDLESTDVAPTHDRGRIYDRYKGRGLARGVASPKGYISFASLETANNPIPPPSSLASTPSVWELLLRILTRLEGASHNLIILDASATPVWSALL